MEKSVFSIDQRLHIGADRATVRYVGSIDGQSGDWVGLEWDNAARGKHDGSVNGRRYFHCAYAENAGTFVRLAKLQQTARSGGSVLQGLQTRYQGAAAGSVAVTSAVKFRLVGEQEVREHQGQLQLLREASLSGDCVSSPGPNGELAAAALALAELDVSGTLIGSWHAALRIMRQLPALRQIDLSRTRLALPAPAQPPAAGLAADRLQTLVLNECRLTWAEVTSLSASVPNLRELFLCGNQISTLECDVDAPPAFPRLQALDLTDNELADWDEVRHLSSLRSLTSLNISANQLQDLTAPLATGSAFSGLQALLCAGNGIGSWATVQALAELPAVADVRLSGNPLFTTTDAGRFEVIARMPGLTLLNGSTVDAMERRDCELHYLRTLLAEAEERPAQLQALEAAHPRLAPLREKYGLMAGTLARYSATHNGSAPMAAGMLTLRLVSDGGGGSCVALQKPIPGCITLKSLRYIMQQLHHVPMRHQELLVRGAADADARSLAGEDDLQTLASLDIKDQSEIRVRLVPDV